MTPTSPVRITIAFLVINFNSFLRHNINSSTSVLKKGRKKQSSMTSSKVLVATFMTQAVFKIPKGLDLYDKTIVKEFYVRYNTLYIEYTDGRTDKIEEEYNNESKEPDETNIEDAEDWGIDSESEEESEDSDED